MNCKLSPRFQDFILSTTKAAGMRIEEEIQKLWSGYGQILRIRLQGSEKSSVVVKHVRLREPGKHPRGWNTDISHERKLKSYGVESTWYRSWSKQCGNTCRVPQFLGFDEAEGEILIILEDLDTVGYPIRLTSLNASQIEACLDWLANFHANFMGAKPDGLWEKGTYWHLATRNDELEKLTELPLKKAATAIDEILSSAKYQTLVHGDAKLANFCFSENGNDVAAVDFQYVGGGCGIKDVAYFIGSCLDEDACKDQESYLLDHYFGTLRVSLSDRYPQIDISELETEWRTLFPVAWTDFHRFLKGWSPGHWKINSYSEQLARKVIASLSSD